MLLVSALLVLLVVAVQGRHVTDFSLKRDAVPTERVR